MRFGCRLKSAYLPKKMQNFLARKYTMVNYIKTLLALALLLKLNCY